MNFLFFIPYLVLFSFYPLSPTPCSYQNKELTNEDIFNSMYSAIKNVKTLRANMTAVERISDASGGHINHTRYSIKLNTSPYKVYTKDLDKGVEVLYLDGQNENKAIVNPNGLPYVNLHLDPDGKIMRTAQHQNILRAGFSYISDVLYHSLVKYPDAYTHYVKRDADTVWDGSSCYKMEISFSSYSNTKYTINEPGETVSKLATKYYLSDYKILTLNNLTDYEEELTVGQQIMLPSAYAKSVILFIRKDNNLPVVVRMFDDKGFYEQYAYTNLQVNSTIPEAEFKEDYKDYHF